MDIDKTGYLFQIGTGNSAYSHLIPTNFNNAGFEGLSAGYNHNLAVVVSDSEDKTAPFISNTKFKKINFSIKKYLQNNDIDIVDNISVISTASGDLKNQVYVNIASPVQGTFSVFESIPMASMAISTGGLTVVNNMVTGGLDLYRINKDVSIDLFKVINDIESPYNSTLYAGTGWATGQTGTYFSGVKFIKSEGINPWDKYATYKAYYNSNINNYNLNSGIFKQGIILKNIKQQNTGFLVASSNNSAWASYNISSGMQENSQNVFSYAIEFARTASFDGYITTGSTGLSEEALNSGLNSQYKNLIIPELSFGLGLSFDEYSAICLSGLDCSLPEGAEEKLQLPIGICYTGNANPLSREYIDFISGIKKKFTDDAYVPGFDNPPSDVIPTGNIVVGDLFSTFTGQLVYNNFISGDSISFSLYPFDYTGEYRKLYNVDPPYPTTGFTLFYGQDFNDILSLRSALNMRLLNVNYPLWHTYDKKIAPNSGIFSTGPLMAFDFELNIDSLDVNYLNIIKFRSLRNVPSGYSISLNLAQRVDPSVSSSILRPRLSGYSYLLPNKIELLGLYNNRWAVLDRQVGVYNMLSTGNGVQLLLSSGKGFEFGNDVIAPKSVRSGIEFNTSTTLEEIAQQGGFQELVKFRQKRFAKPPGKFCLPPGPFEREITVFTPTGWPVGVNGCTGTIVPEEEQGEQILPEWTDWYPDLNNICTGERVLQTRLDKAVVTDISGKNSVSCPTIEDLGRPVYSPQFKYSSGAKQSIYNDWYPSTTGVCNGTVFTQVRFDINGCDELIQERDATGSYTGIGVGTLTGWYPSETEFCSSSVFIQRRISGCNNVLSRLMTGTMQSAWTEWLPNASGVCEGFIFTQSRVDGIGCSGIEYRLATGIRRGPNRGYVPDVYVNMLRTGWNLDRNGQFLRDVIPQEGTLACLSFSGYKIKLSDFSGISDPTLKPLNEFYVKNINLFGAKKIPNNIHYASDVPIIGSDYVVDIKGTVPVRITGEYEYTISGTQESGPNCQSGIFKLRNAQIIYQIPQGIKTNPIKFNKSYGYIAGDTATGFLTTTLSGTGYISHTFGDSYYYDPISKKISFEKTVGKNLLNSVSGILSLKTVVLKQNTVNKSLAAGGFFSTAASYQEKYQDGYFSGNVDGIIYRKNNLTGYYYLTGIVTGNSVSGYFNPYKIVTGKENTSDNNNLPWYPEATGYINASAIINYNTGYIKNFDFISINNTSVIYNTDSANYTAPEYFNNITGLVNIINNKPDIFACSGYLLNNTIILNSLLSGESGNVPITIGGTGLNISSSGLTGGKNLYSRFYIYDNNIYTGFLDYNFPSIETGKIINNASGYISGNINSYAGNRTFFDIWNLKTGNQISTVFFNEKNLTGLNCYSGNLVSNTLGTLPSTIDLKVTYKNYLSTITGIGEDIAEIMVTGYDMIGTGSLGSIFRITGIK